MEDAITTFVPEDIQEEAARLGLDNDMPLDLAEEIMLDYRNAIMNAMTEAGWLVIDEALRFRYATKGERQIMNNITENDLSFAAFSVRELRDRMHKENSELGKHCVGSDITGIHLTAKWLLETAKDLAIAADCYAVLLGCRSRSEITFVKK